MRLRQPQEMPLCGEDLSESVAKGGVQVTGLTGFFSDDEDCHAATLAGIGNNANCAGVDIPAFIAKSSLGVLVGGDCSLTEHRVWWCRFTDAQAIGCGH